MCHGRPDLPRQKGRPQKLVVELAADFDRAHDPMAMMMDALLDDTAMLMTVMTMPAVAWRGIGSNWCHDAGKGQSEGGDDEFFHVLNP